MFVVHNIFSLQNIYFQFNSLFLWLQVQYTIHQYIYDIQYTLPSPKKMVKYHMFSPDSFFLLSSRKQLINSFRLFRKLKYFLNFHRNCSLPNYWSQIKFLFHDTKTCIRKWGGFNLKKNMVRQRCMVKVPTSQCFLFLTNIFYNLESFNWKQLALVNTMSKCWRQKHLSDKRSF